MRPIRSPLAGSSAAQWLKPSSSQRARNRSICSRVRVEIARRHELEELRLGVDRRQRLGVVVAPLAQQQALGAKLGRDHPDDSMRSRRDSAPALSSGSFRFPHLGDWTQDGQPCSHGQPASMRAVSCDPALERVVAAPREADAAGVAVVDEDRRPARLEVDVGGEPADVPAVAHRPERQDRDHRVLGRMERPEELRHLLVLGELLGLGQVPDRLGLERRLGQVERRRRRATSRPRSPSSGSRPPAR